MLVILPKSRPELSDYLHLPLFFLAGPIRGADDWQFQMCNMLADQVGECIIANPRRYEANHPLYQQRFTAGHTESFPHQTAWERHYLEEAGEGFPMGCIIFWLACESKEHPRNDGNPYAMDTRGEIGEWRGRMLNNKEVRVVMGGDPHFPGFQTIKRNNEALGGLLPIHESMEETVRQAHIRTLRY